MTTNNFSFTIIDDSKLDCFIAEKIISNTGVNAKMKSFTSASEALEYIKNNPAATDVKNIIMVDIQMPIMNGFDFVEAFEQLPAEISSNYTVYMLSSSINENDLNRVKNYRSIKQFINKPLTSSVIAAILEIA